MRRNVYPALAQADLQELQNITELLKAQVDLVSRRSARFRNLCLAFACLKQAIKALRVLNRVGGRGSEAAWRDAHSAATRLQAQVQSGLLPPAMHPPVQDCLQRIEDVLEGAVRRSEEA